MSIIFRFLFLLPLWMVFVGFSNSAQAAKPSTMLVVGDSLSAAYGIPIEQGWVALLENRLKQQQLPYEVVNISMSGDTTSQGLAKLPTALNQYKPTVVIIALGANDGLRGLPVSLIQKNLNRMVLLSKQAHAKVLLIGLLLPINYGPVYRHNSNRYIAISEINISYCSPLLLKDIALKPELTQADGLHPTAAAQPMILDNVWPYLEKTLTKQGVKCLCPDLTPCFLENRLNFKDE